MALSCMDFYDVYKERTIEDFSDPQTGEECSVVNTSSMLFGPVSRIIRAVAVLEKDSKEHFEMPSSKCKDRLVFSKAEQCILSAVTIDYVELERGMVLFKVNPYISLFVDCYNELRPTNPLKAEPSEMYECFAGLRLFARTLREHLKGSEFKRKNSAHLRSSNKNYVGLVKYIDSLFDRYSRMLVVRVDFSYGKGRIDLEGCSDLEERANALRIVTNEIIGHRLELISYLKNKCPQIAMVGYVWKLEYGREKGHHYHMMFFLDGSKVRQDVVIARLIGEYWNNVVTNGRGVYYNCNGNKDRYKYCGVGMISHSELEKIQNLKTKAAVYLTKSDRFVSACMPDNKRSFGKGNSPKVALRRVGRPRECFVNSH